MTTRNYFAHPPAWTLDNVPGARQFVIPTWADILEVHLWAAGGGAGSGMKGPLGTIRDAGGPGGSGGYSVNRWRVADLPAILDYTVGLGGVGGLPQATDSTPGNFGAAGGNSFLGIDEALNCLLRATGGGGGLGGTATNGTGGAGGAGSYNGIAGPNASATGLLGPNGSSTYAAGSGGAGGGLTAANVAAIGGNGGVSNALVGVLNALGGAVDQDGADATVLANLYQLIGGRGGGGGGAFGVVKAGKGGKGWRGGGGGSGGAGTNGLANSGQGGDGGNGAIIFIAK